MKKNLTDQEIEEAVRGLAPEELPEGFHQRLRRSYLDTAAPTGKVPNPSTVALFEEGSKSRVRYRFLSIAAAVLLPVLSIFLVMEWFKGSEKDTKGARYSTMSSAQDDARELGSVRTSEEPSFINWVVIKVHREVGPRFLSPPEPAGGESGYTVRLVLDRYELVGKESGKPVTLSFKRYEIAPAPKKLSSEDKVISIGFHSSSRQETHTETDSASVSVSVEPDG